MRGRSLLLGGLMGAVPLGIAAAQIAPHPALSRARLGRPESSVVQAPRFEVDPMWPNPMPNHWILGSVTGLTIDSRDHVFVVNLTDSFNKRTETGMELNPPGEGCCAPSPNVLEFDASGNLVGHFGGPGAGYEWPEMNAGVGVDGAGNVWIGGQGGADSRILKFGGDGTFIAEFGKPAGAVVTAGTERPDTAYEGVSPARGRGGRDGRGRGGPVRAPALPANSNSMDTFGGPARFSFDTKANEAYVADGYRNHRVAVIDMTTGAIKRYWGAYGNKPDDSQSSKYAPGTPPKQFGVVRCAMLSRDGYVYVCDATNDRIQVFTKAGKFVKEGRVAPQTLGAGSVWDIAFSRDPQQKYLYVADGMNMKVHILERQSLEELSSFGDGGRQPGQFYAVDAIATDSKGNIYTAETYESKRVQKFNFKGVGSAPANAGVVWPARRGKP